MKEYLKIIDEIIALVGLHLIPKFVNLYQGQVDIRCEENDTGVLINIIVSLPDKNELQALQNQWEMTVRIGIKNNRTKDNESCVECPLIRTLHLFFLYIHVIVCRECLFVLPLLDFTLFSVYLRSAF